SGTGGPWSVIKTSTGNVTSFMWSPIPAIQSTDGYIRVTARDGSGTDTDVNNAPIKFYMPPAPVFHVQYPVGGETLDVGQPVEIKWWGGGRLNKINISLSTAGTGGPWTLLTSSQPNIGVYSWTVPNSPSTNCYIKVHAHDIFNRFAEDLSNSSFTIKPPPFTVQLTKPQTGIIFNPGQATQIEWLTSGGTGPYRTDLLFSSTGSSGPWTSVAAAQTGNVYQWTVPTTLTTNGFVRANVTDTGTSQSTSDANDGPFTIARPKPTARVIGPNGAEKLLFNTTATVSWTGSGGSGPLTFDVAYSTNGIGGPWTDLLTASTQTSLQWPVPSIATTNGFIRVKATDGFENVEDTSDSAFQIAKPVSPFSVSLASPAGGENWEVGQTHNVEWTSTGAGPFKVSLHYSLAGLGGPWADIAIDVADSGTESWTIAILDKTYVNCFVRVTLTKTTTGESVTSNNPKAFTITRPPSLAGITGQVVDFDSKKGLEGVEVRLVNTPHFILTDVDGYFGLAGVLPGPYILEASKDNFDLYRKDVNVPPDKIIELKIELVSHFSPSKGRQNIGQWLTELAPIIIVLVFVAVAAAAILVSFKRRGKRVKAANCLNCGIPVQGGQLVCARCAAKSNQRVCPKCKNMGPADSGWCVKCGNDISSLGPATPPSTQK
ncbi:MAG TPA: carboxypeptidase regulatory-like domain-containing protein, partial [Thermoplasmata archaeon]|nr:carboxypeptidase regulatory-like domain-containing protein [Thermoplasmata archaeon]